MHRDSPIRLDHSFPHLWKYNLTIRADEVIVSFMYVWSNNINMEKGLLDQFFHSLGFKSVPCPLRIESTETHLPSLTYMPREAELSAHCILELDRRFWSVGWFQLGGLFFSSLP